MFVLLLSKTMTLRRWAFKDLRDLYPETYMCRRSQSLKAVEIRGGRKSLTKGLALWELRDQVFGVHSCMNPVRVCKVAVAVWGSCSFSHAAEKKVFGILTSLWAADFALEPEYFSRYNISQSRASEINICSIALSWWMLWSSFHRRRKGVPLKPLSQVWEQRQHSEVAATETGCNGVLAKDPDCMLWPQTQLV